MILIDTSAWIEFFRGRGGLGDAVDDALSVGQAALCGPVQTELRRGLPLGQRKQVLSLLAGCHELETPNDLWVEAGDLGFFLARRGVSVKTLDLLIASYALCYDVELLTKDSDFHSMVRVGVGLRLASH